MTHTRIAVCSDTHLWPGAKVRYGYESRQLQPWSEKILETLLAEMSVAEPDYVFHLGDITCGGGTYEMPSEAFFSTLNHTLETFQTLPAQFFALPGNHDCPVGGNWSFLEDRLGLRPGLGQTIDLAQARLILLNAQGHSPEQLTAALPGDPTHGWVSEAELVRLEDALAGSGDRPVLIFVHQLLKPWQGEQPWADLYGVQNGEAVLEILGRYNNVRAVFQAHAHRFDVQQVRLGNRPCWFVVNPAVMEYPLAWLQLDIGSGELQVSLRCLPLPELAQLSRDTGEGQAWRKGHPDWKVFSISF